MADRILIVENLVLRASRELTRWLRRDRDPRRFLEHACACLAATPGYRLVWFGALAPDGQTLQPRAHAGNGADFLDLVAAAPAEARALELPWLAALRTQQVVVRADAAGEPAGEPWRDAARARGFGAIAAIPALALEHGYGVLCVHADRAQAFGPEELELLRDFGSDLAFGLRNLENEVERRRAEKQVRDSEALYHSLVENLPQCIFRKDWDGRITFVNQRFCAVRGEPRETLLGRTDFDLYPRALAEKYREDDLRVMNTGETLEAVEGHVTPTGQQLYVQVVKTPLRNAVGKVIGVQGIFWDITAARSAEEQLRLLSRAVEQSPASIVITDAQGCIEYVNPKFTQVTGYRLEEVRGHNPRILKGGSRSAEEYRGLWETILAGQEWRGEFLNRRKDGSLFWENALISPVTDPTGRITHFLAVKEDITDRKRAEEELRQAKEAAEAANRAKSEFLANMSHEIRTPLNGVIGMTGLLLDTPLSPEQREYTEIVRSSGEALLSVINDILDFSKIEAGKLDLELLDFDLRALIEETMDTLALKAEEKHLEFVCLVDPGVATTLRGDPARLRQVLINLTSNAIKFTANGEITVRVQPGPPAGDDLIVRFQIDDTGIGIAPEQMARLFQPFTQLEASSSRRFGGSGLGLSISRRLVALMGGEIGVESQPGRGSTFWFTARFRPASVPILPPSSDRTPLTGWRVLIVDDHSNNRRLLDVLIRSWGGEPEEAESALQALSRLQAAAAAGRPFELAILDLHMPEIDGRELGRRIKATPGLQTTLLVMLASLMDRGDSELLQTIGFEALLTKPVKQAQLRECLVRLRAGREEGAASSDPRLASGLGSTRPPRRRIRVLVAEDNITNQKVALSLLAKLGFRADAVANGWEAIRLLETTPYDLVLMDCQMPELDGYETTRRIRSLESRVRNHQIPIIAMTAHALKGDRERCLAAGMDDYLPKPIHPATLAEALDRWSPDLEPSPPPMEIPNPPLAAESVQAFNRPALVARVMGDVDMAREIARTFLEEAPRQWDELVTAFAQGQVEACRRHAHTLKGATGNVGGDAAHQLAATLEAAAKTGSLAGARPDLDRLAVAFAELLVELRGFLAEAAGTPTAGGTATSSPPAGSSRST